MNKIKIIIIFVFIALLNSCTDAIDFEQPGILHYSDLYKTVDDLQDGLVGVYSFMDNTAEIKFNSVYTDEVSIGVQSGGQAKAEYALNLDSSSTSPYVIWVNTTITIDRANRVLAAAETITPEEGEQDQYNNIIGQLYAIRAYEHFVLQTYFSEDITDDTKLGGVLMDRVFPIEEAAIPRSLNSDVFAFIEDDLTKAESMIADDNGITFFGKDAIKALKARIYSYRGLYDLAEPLASDLLSNYPITNQANFANIWTDNGNNGVIFKLERTRNDSHDSQSTTMAAGGWAGAMFAFGISGGVQSAYLEMSRSLFNKIDPSDVRYTSYIDHNTSIIDPNYLTSINVLETDVLAIGKYLGSESQVLMNDLKIFRSAEMLFLVAEARANAHDYSAVSSLLKQLEDKRLDTSTTALTITSDEEAYAAILAARRIELCFEGFRWVDLKRLGVKANVEIDRDVRDCEINGACSMDKNDHRFTLPIPVSELDVNPNLTQNSGY